VRDPSVGGEARPLESSGKSWARLNLEKWRRRTEQLKAETYALYLAYGDPRVPRHAKLFAALVVGYAVSPVDLIPDFIPILGHLDDLVLLPLGVALARRMIPDEVLSECRQRARADGRRWRPETP
jgi:uncharacterized membrane protein YkvA (DUF1232 family)